MLSIWKDWFHLSIEKNSLSSSSAFLQLVAVASAMRWMCDDVVEGRKGIHCQYFFWMVGSVKVRTRYFFGGLYIKSSHHVERDLLRFQTKYGVLFLESS
jgi:hypothetical protein